MVLFMIMFYHLQRAKKSRRKEKRRKETFRKQRYLFIITFQIIPVRFGHWLERFILTHYLVFC